MLSGRSDQSGDKLRDRGSKLRAGLDERLRQERVERAAVSLDRRHPSLERCQDLFLGLSVIKQIAARGPPILIVLGNTHQDPLAPVEGTDLVDRDRTRLLVLK